MENHNLVDMLDKIMAGNNLNSETGTAWHLSVKNLLFHSMSLAILVEALILPNY